MKSRALWRYLWKWTLWALGIAWITLMGASYYAGLHEAQEITDAHLASTVNVLLQVAAFGTQAADADAIAPNPVGTGSQSFIPVGRHLDFARSLAVLVWDNGVVVADSRPAAQRALLDIPNGYSIFTTQSGSQSVPHHWRVFAAQRSDTSRRAVAMIDLDQPAYIGRRVALTIARPAVIVLPLIGLLLWWSTRRGLKPLNDLSARVAGLKLQSGERLGESYGFSEFASVVSAINGLIDRLELQANRERTFASDVAHELRTPLAAIALQSQTALQETDPAARAQALEVLAGESMRAGNILGELLDMARAQRFGAEAMQPVDLGELAARVMARFAQSSFENGHTLELIDEAGPVVVIGNPMLLELAVRNLIANALVHTRPGTLVQVSVANNAAGCTLAVSDNGHGGVAPSTRLTQNLGIGLSLVERIAGQHGATLVRDSGDAPMSTRFSIVWPADAPNA